MLKRIIVASVLTGVLGASVVSPAMAASHSGNGSTEREAAAAVLEPFIATASLRSNVDYFMHMTMNIAHDVIHPSEPEMFGAQPGFIRVLEALQSSSGEIVDVCQQGGGYQIKRLLQIDPSDLVPGSALSDPSAASLHIMRLEYDGCRIDRYGWDVVLDGGFTFYLSGEPVEGQLTVRAVRYGRSGFGQSAVPYKTTTIHQSTQEVSLIEYRNYAVIGSIPSTVREDLGFLAGELNVLLHGEIRNEYKIHYNNEVYDARSKNLAKFVYLSGGYFLGQKVNPDSLQSERAASQILHMRSGEFTNNSEGYEPQSGSLESTNFKFEDVEFIDSDPGLHRWKFDGRATIRNSVAPASCGLGTFSVDTRKALYVPYYQVEPVSGVIAVGQNTKATFNGDGSIALISNGQEFEYVNMEELREAAQCWMY